MGFLNELFGKRTEPGFGAIDIDNFDSLNEEAGREAGDEVMQAYVDLVARLAQQTNILNEQGFHVYLHARAGKDVEGGGRLLRDIGKDAFALCRPYESGDEFIIHHADGTKVTALLGKVVEAAAQLRVRLRNEEGLVTQVLHGLPVSTGFGPTWKEAWSAVIAGREGRGPRPSMKERLRPATPEETIIGDAPRVDPKTGLPATFDVFTEQTPAGLVPVLMWGPVEVRRPGWTDRHQEAMRWAIAKLAVSKGITDPGRILELVKEVTELRNRAWSAIGASIMARQGR